MLSLNPVSQFFVLNNRSPLGGGVKGASKRHQTRCGHAKTLARRAFQLHVHGDVLVLSQQRRIATCLNEVEVERPISSHLSVCIFHMHR
jgi:hypothetical protein